MKKEQFIATSCVALMLSAFLPTLSTAKASELTKENINTYVQTNVNNVPLKTAQPSLIGIGPGQIQIGNSNMDQLTLRISQTFTQNDLGNYVFDETKARALGFSEDDWCYGYS